MSRRNLRNLVFALIAGAALAGTPVAAQDGRSLEVTPFFGYDFGGSFEVFDPEFGNVDFELDDSESYGVIFDFPISRFFQVEALVFRQPTALQIDEGIFGTPFELTDMDIDYLQAGILWQGSVGQAKPFFAGGIGLARLNPDIPELDTENRLAFNLGGGIKTFFTPNFGLRFEGRLLIITLPEDDPEFFCCGQEDDSLAQGHVSLGLIFAF